MKPLALLALAWMLAVPHPLADSALARSPAPAACEGAAAHQFDFWVGTWRLTWGENGTGTNTVRRILGGCVIEEAFEGQMKSGPYRGRSVSVYDAATEQWRQTWVDDQGGYLDFAGAFDGETMILRRTTTNEAGATIHQRMVWYNIEADRLDWDWEKSEDGGATWTTLWTIHYERAE